LDLWLTVFISPQVKAAVQDLVPHDLNGWTMPTTKRGYITTGPRGLLKGIHRYNKTAIRERMAYAKPM